jgi:hypothetical protein
MKVLTLIFNSQYCQCTIRPIPVQNGGILVEFLIMVSVLCRIEYGALTTSGDCGLKHIVLYRTRSLHVTSEAKLQFQGIGYWQNFSLESS